MPRVQEGRGHLTLRAYRLPSQCQGMAGARGDAEATPDAAIRVMHNAIIFDREGLHLAAVQTPLTVRADIWVKLRDESACYCLRGLRLLLKAAQDPAAAAAATADRRYELGVGRVKDQVRFVCLRYKFHDLSSVN